jgi:hypothetical protein
MYVDILNQISRQTLFKATEIITSRFMRRRERKTKYFKRMWDDWIHD